MVKARQLPITLSTVVQQVYKENILKYLGTRIKKMYCSTSESRNNLKTIKVIK